MFTILADAAATSMTLSDLAPMISTAGSLGFAVWFGVYVMMYHLPAQQKEHRDQLEKRDEMLERLEERHQETVKAIVEELRSGRESFDRWRMAPRQN